MIHFHLRTTWCSLLAVSLLTTVATAQEAGRATINSIVTIVPPDAPVAPTAPAAKHTLRLLPARAPVVKHSKAAPEPVIAPKPAPADIVADIAADEAAGEADIPTRQRTCIPNQQCTRVPRPYHLRRGCRSVHGPCCKGHCCREFRHTCRRRTGDTRRSSSNGRSGPAYVPRYAFKSETAWPPKWFCTVTTLKKERKARR